VWGEGSGVGVDGKSKRAHTGILGNACASRQSIVNNAYERL
jgi:hypothetical protein